MKKCKKQTLGLKLVYFLMILSGSIFSAQAQRTVSGTVTDNKGGLLPGVNVVVKGTNRGVVADFDGNYNIKVDTGEVLLFSFVGFEAKEKLVGGMTIMNVVLQESSENLDEVVVVAYGTKKKRDVIGSIAKVDGAKIAQTATGSITTALAGRASGVQVTNGQVTLRGISSINSGNSPLWIVDGVGGGQGDINPNDVESIEVLKDAAATAVYGSRASNGVIIVTTKRGKRGNPRFNLNYHSGISQLTNTDLGYAGTDRLFDIMEIGSQNYDGTSWDFQQSVMSQNPWATGNETITNEEARSINTNWNDLLTRAGSYHDVNFSASSGTENSNLYATINYRSYDGNYIHDEGENVSGRLNVEFVKGSLTYGLRVFGKYSESSNSGAGFVHGLTWLPVYSDTNASGYWNAETGANPLANSDPKFRSNNNRNFGVNSVVFAKWKMPFVQGLTLSANYQPNISMGKSDSYKAGAITQNFATQGNTGNGSATQSYGYVFNSLVNYNHTFGEDHNIDFVGGFEQGASKSTWTGVQGTNLLGVFHEVKKSTDPITGSDYLSSEGYRRNFFSRLDYKFKDRYLIGVSASREGSAKFVKENRWGTFYSGSAGWIISDENFLSSADWISLLKLRGSIGQTGNSSIPYVTETNYSTNISIRNYGGVGNTYITNFANKLASWETSTMSDFGVDFGFLKNRINGSIAYYKQDVEDMLLATPLPYSSGLASGNGGTARGGSFVENIGDMVNKGIELDVSWIAVNNDKFSWTVGGNVAFNENKVVALNPEADITGKGIIKYAANRYYTLTRSGAAIGQYYLPESAGVDPQTGVSMIYEVDREVYEETGATVKTGRLIPATTNNKGNNRMIQEDKTALPTFYGGFFNDFKYKNFDLSVLFSFQGGNYIYNDDLYKGLGTGSAPVLADAYTKSWEKPGDITEYPQLMYANRYPYDDEGEYVEGGKFLYDGAESKYLQRGDYMKLKELVLGYSIPASVLDRLGVSKFRLYFNATNLFTITDYTGFDPELQRYGGDGVLNGMTSRSSMPQTRTFSLGINLNF
ncbi:hypothetical protein B4Q04_15095 [Zobellia sp. OII3]|uniref:SusC/RagA family TonB-linked outer membrane protein n=1 Tax=Zobellia sp. OII3 TaxID=2034520 RepID=UPI000B52AD61|nr:SusC/RagA family TonB-linked outer membrane protein [Zobellia sp. OII3]OWW24642.1 hypothetical protein B4Q04_15095 [Zobellia sp. OII3]